MAHETYMARCIELAKNGLGTTYPNPLVGSVIVYKDTIIGEGWHKKSGEAHAEVNAVNSVADKSLLPLSTIYVSLEPCSHFGKTPPCADLLISHKFKRVVIGTQDPNEIVAGNGIRKLQEAGIEVIVGILEEECKELNKRFFCFHKNKRPYIILKWAESADGFLSPSKKDVREPVYITNRYSRQLVHKWRSEEQAILIGSQTAVDDNPRLDVREWAGNNPIRIVIDNNARISPESHIFDNQVKKIVFSGQNYLPEKENVIVEPVDANRDVLPQVISALHKHKIQSVIIEGGAYTLKRFIDSGLWDEARVFKGNAIFRDGTKAPEFLSAPAIRTTIVNDELLIYRK